MEKIEITIPRELTDEEAYKLECALGAALEEFDIDEWALVLDHAYDECPACKYGGHCNCEG